MTVLPLLMSSSRDDSAWMPPPQGVPYTILPPPPDEDSAALRFHGGAYPHLMRITPDTPVLDINAQFERCNIARATMGIPSSSLDYRVVLVADPGTYNVAPWENQPPWLSVIAEQITDPPSVVLYSAEDSKWAGVLECESLHLEGVEVLNVDGPDDGVANGVCDLLQVGDGSTGEKYCIHFHGGARPARLNLAHCLLKSEAHTHPNLGMDNDVGDSVQMYATTWQNLPGASGMNAHCGNVDLTQHVHLRFKACDFASTGYLGWDDLTTGNIRIAAGADHLQVKDCIGVISGGADPLPIETVPIVWDVI